MRYSFPYYGHASRSLPPGSRAAVAGQRDHGYRQASWLAGSRNTIILAVVALGLLLGLPLTVMQGASAAPAHAVVTQTHHVALATTPKGTFDVWFSCQPAGNQCEETFTCHTAGNHTAPGPLENGYAGSLAWNNCNVRVWLYQNSNGTGYRLCISPSDGMDIYRYYDDLQVSTNPAHC